MRLILDKATMKVMAVARSASDLIRVYAELSAGGYEGTLVIWCIQTDFSRAMAYN